MPQFDDVMAELASLDGPKMRATNEEHGDDHGVNWWKDKDDLIGRTG